MSAEAVSTALSIPTIIWSGVVASFISLAGIVLSNRSSLVRLKEQLRHDSDEKYRDRISQLRKEVYLELTTQITLAGGYLGSLAGKDPTSEDLADPFQAAMAELAKAQLVGTRETSALAAELSTLYSEALVNLVAAAKPMHDLNIDIKISTDSFDEEMAQAERVLAEMAAINESGTINPARMDALQQSFKNYQRNYTQYSEDRETAVKSRNILDKSFLQALLEEMSKISPTEMKLTCAIRNEIGLDTDAFELTRRMEDNHARMEKAAVKLLAHLDAS